MIPILDSSLVQCFSVCDPAGQCWYLAPTLEDAWWCKHISLHPGSCAGFSTFQTASSRTLAWWQTVLRDQFLMWCLADGGHSKKQAPCSLQIWASRPWAAHPSGMKYTNHSARTKETMLCRGHWQYIHGCQPEGRISKKALFEKINFKCFKLFHWHFQWNGCRVY